jgi:hypothetical protein
MIKPKEKKCKGSSKAIGLGCGEMALFRKWGLCNGCLKDFYMNTPEGQKELLKAAKTVSAPRKSLEKAIKTDKETKGIQAALTNTKQVVHEMVRLRDEGKTCISCPTQWNNTFQAGHCYPTKYRSIRFNFNNINGQCQNCNLFLDGNETQYLINLPKRIGEDKFNELKRLADLDGSFNKHWTKDELTEIRKEAKAIINKIKTK